MGDLNISFVPLLPWTVIGALGVIAAAAVAVALYGRLAGWWLRLLAFGVLILALAGPQLRQEEREGLTNVAFLVVDKSASTELGDRRAMIDAAAETLTRGVAALDEPQNPFELVTVEVDGKGEGDRGTRLLSALDEAAARVTPGQIAGAMLLTDGQIHDAERMETFPAPVHALIAGQKEGFDLRLALETAPAYGIVGEPVTFQLRAEALGLRPAELGGNVAATIAVDGGLPRPLLLGLDRTTDLSVDIEHGGPTVVDIQIVPRDDEMTTRNNRVIVTVNGVRDRLRVLLVSGEPHPGGRTWRDLLKSDPTVELIHFTILRPPSKQDGTPVGELSLIAFPTRELFLEKIDGFDLIVFDRYRWRGVLSSGYLANVARYVREGGAIMVASGPSFSGAESLYRTPLADVLPAEPAVSVLEAPFLPKVTELGQRHPVTAGLHPPGKDPTWGRWLRQIEVVPISGNTVMEGKDQMPLLILDRVGDGRVALLASDHAWLWSRGYEGGGPQSDLLRRVAHWLMKEPELEEEALFARVDGNRIIAERRSLAEEAPDSVTVLPPSGETGVTARYEQVAPGRWQAVVEDAEEGLWRLNDGQQSAVAAVGPPSPAEYANPLATEEMLASLTDESGGTSRWLVDGVPTLRAVSEGRRAGGRGWIGLESRDAYRVTGVRLTELLPAWLAALSIGLLLLVGWMREGR